MNDATLKIEKRTADFTGTWRPPKDVRAALRRGEKRIKAWRESQGRGQSPKRRGER